MSGALLALEMGRAVRDGATRAIEWRDEKRRRLFFFGGGELLLVQSNLRSETPERVAERSPGLDGDELAEAVSRTRVFEALAEPRGELLLHPDAPAPAFEPLDVHALLLAAADRLPPLPPDAHPRAVPALASQLARIPVRAEVVHYLMELDGTRDLEDVLAFGPEEPERLGAALGVAVLIGAVDPGGLGRPNAPAVGIAVAPAPRASPAAAAPPAPAPRTSPAPAAPPAVAPPFPVAPTAASAPVAPPPAAPPAGVRAPVAAPSASRAFGAGLSDLFSDAPAAAAAPPSAAPFAASGDPFAASGHPFAASGDPFAASADPFGSGGVGAPPAPAPATGDPFAARAPASPPAPPPSPAAPVAGPDAGFEAFAASGGGASATVTAAVGRPVRPAAPAPADPAPAPASPPPKG